MEKLSLRDNNITMQGEIHLSLVKKVKILDLASNDIAEKRVKELKATAKVSGVCEMNDFV